VAVAAVVLVLLLVGGDGSSTTTQGPTTTLDKYAFVEVAEDDFPLSELSEAKFASYTEVDASVMTARMATSNQPSFKKLVEAIAAAQEVDSTVSATGCQLDFVFHDRRHVQFEVSVAANLIARAGKVWRPKADLNALLEAFAKQ